MAAIHNTGTTEHMPNALVNARARRHPRPTAIIADDHLLMAQGLARLVEAELEVLAVVGNGRQVLEVAMRQSTAGGPNLVLMDICMPELSGVETTRKLREIAPDCKVILISMHSEPEFIREAFRVGASGYLLKISAASELMAAIREVMGGSVYLSSGIERETLCSLVTPAPALSPRQREVLRLVAEGCSAKEVAERLQITVKTAQFHKMSIMAKLSVHTTAELTKYALGHGIAS
jgi:DNA-binding NarL/FixJ family response regulator